MGTNYYARPKCAWDDNPAGERTETSAYPAIHLGKRSAGWEFLFRAHPELGVMTVGDLRRFLDHPWVVIESKTGEALSLAEFMLVATECGPAPAKHSDSEVHRDERGYPFAFYEFC
jgi:hypothetical protein